MSESEALMDEVLRLRTALRPFVDCHFTYFCGKVRGSDAKLTREDVERARALLADESGVMVDAEHKQGELPPLPPVDYDAGWHRQYTADQMRDYARAALAAGVSASDGQTSPGIPASSALDSSASGESTSGQVHSGDAPASAPLAGGSDGS